LQALKDLPTPFLSSSLWVSVVHVIGREAKGRVDDPFDSLRSLRTSLWGREGSVSICVICGLLASGGSICVHLRDLRFSRGRVGGSSIQYRVSGGWAAFLIPNS
jgi:hypothetical protein